MFHWSLYIIAVISIILRTACTDDLPEGNKQCHADQPVVPNGKYLPANVYKNFISKFGANNTLNASSVYNLVSAALIFKENKAGLRCKTSQVLFQNGYDKNATIDIQAFHQICPALLQVVEDEVDIRSYGRQYSQSTETPSSDQVWGYGLLSVTAISLCSLIGIGILPLMNKSFYNKILLYLIALAVGTLSSNSVFQLIPEGFGISGNPIIAWRSAVVFGGFYMFYLFENVLERLFKVGEHNRGVAVTSIEDSMKHDNSYNQTSNIIPSTGDAFIPVSSPPSESEPSGAQSNIQLLVDSSSSHASKLPATGSPSGKKIAETSRNTFSSFKQIKTLAWMITIADGMHNFIDGLAIGASFSISLVQGVSTSIAIFCEEFPHELGDFAILLSAGMTVRQAAFFNFASACCCYIGFFFGVLVGHDISSARWIFSIAGGVFLYISLAVMLPEAQAQACSRDLRKTPWKAFVIQNLGLLTGFLSILLLTLYQDEITGSMLR